MSPPPSPTARFWAQQRRQFLAGSLLAIAGTGPFVRRAVAAQTLRIAEQFGVAYLPLHVARQRQLIEQRAAAQGLEVNIEWVKLSGGAALADALLSGSIDIATGGVAPLVTIWDRTRGRLDVQGIGALADFPYVLTSNRPAVKTIADLGQEDRIAVPAVGNSIQARILQMAAAKTFGADQWSRLDKLTVTLPHPEATAAMLSGRTEITAHFTTPPFQQQQLKSPNIHAILSSDDVLGGPSTAVAMWATRSFREQQGVAYAAFRESLLDAFKIIEADRKAAAATYVEVEKSRLDLAFVEQVVAEPRLRFGLTPNRTEAFAHFMHDIGVVKTRATSWRDYFAPELHELGGS